MILKKNERPFLVSVEKIWDRSPHNALTDLIRFKDVWYCTFRESDQHVDGKNGIIRIITSSDGLVWKSTAVFQAEGVDLRDPKLSITPNNQLMLLCGGTIYSAEKKYISRRPRVAFSKDGIEWTPFTLILEDHEWLWRVTWHKGKAYGVSYRLSNPNNRYEEWEVRLFETEDGVNYQLLTKWDLAGYPNEATIRFSQSDEMIALLRRDQKSPLNKALIGISKAPFQSWRWETSSHQIGGPNFIMLANGDMWAGGRFFISTPWGIFERTALAKMTLKDLHPVLTLPSSGDTSYPGLVFHEGTFWMTYYSSHEHNTAIYLAKIQIT